jgi:hypothetical protein
MHPDVYMDKKVWIVDLSMDKYNFLINWPRYYYSQQKNVKENPVFFFSQFKFENK